MRTFSVDDDLVELVWQRAKPAPFEQLSFSDALRRVLNSQPAPGQNAITSEPQTSEPKSTRSAAPPPTARRIGRSVSGGRAPKADLRELVRFGLLANGQELFLVDFRGERHPRGRAKISANDLVYSDGQRYSMSGLASLLLKEQGYVADAVRGPDHWVTAEGHKVRELWEGAVVGGRDK